MPHKIFVWVRDSVYLIILVYIYCFLRKEKISNIKDQITPTSDDTLKYYLLYFYRENKTTFHVNRLPSLFSLKHIKVKFRMSSADNSNDMTNLILSAK